MKYFLLFILSGLSVQLAAHAVEKHDSDTEDILVRLKEFPGNSTGLPQERGAGDQFGPTHEDTERQSTGAPEIKRKYRGHSDEDGLSIETPLFGQDTANIAQDFIEKAAGMASRVFAEYTQKQEPYIRGRHEKLEKKNFVVELNVDTILRTVEKVLKSSMVKNLASNLAKQMSVMYRAFQDEN